MNYLLDTHTLIWSIVYPDKLSPQVKKIIKSTDSSSWVSAVTFWEIALKFAIGKLNLKGTTPDELYEYSASAGFVMLDLKSETAVSFYKLTRLKNKDPFDLMLAWQAISGDFVLLTRDPGFNSYSKYGLKTAW